MLLALVLAVSCLGTAALAAETVDKVETIEMHRLYNPNTGEHFYTGSLEERDDLVALGWQYEGVAWTAPTNEGEPVYRMFNPNSGDHHYTMSAEERDNLVEVGWQYEGVAWNSYSDDIDYAGVAHHRLYNPNAQTGNHHYTASIIEVTDLIKAGWNYEGIAYYGYAARVYSDMMHRISGHLFQYEADWIGPEAGCRYFACYCGVRWAQHDEGWVMTKAPTATAAGEKEFCCPNCKLEKKAQIPAGSYASLPAAPIYFIDGDQNYIYSINPDGTGRKCVIERECYSVQQGDGFVIYSSIEDGSYIYYVYDVMTQETKKASDVVHSYGVDGVNWYYSKHRDSSDGESVLYHHNLATGEENEILATEKLKSVSAGYGMLYVIAGNGIFKEVNGIPLEGKEVYIYNPETKTKTALYEPLENDYYLDATKGGVILQRDYPEIANTAFLTQDDTSHSVRVDRAPYREPAINQWPNKHDWRTVYIDDSYIVYLNYDFSGTHLVSCPYDKNEFALDIKGTNVLLTAKDAEIDAVDIDNGRILIRTGSGDYLFDAEFFHQTQALIPLPAKE